MLPGRVPWWLEEAGAADEALAPPLVGEVDADAVVVGAGYTGLWTALALRDRDPGARIVVLEAGRAGWGPSGRNGGFLHGFWSGIGWLRDLVGDAGAVALCRAADGAIPAVRNLGTDVWLREAGMLRVATTAPQEAAVDRAVGAARAVGAPDEAVPLDAAQVRARCDSPRFRRAVLFRDGATVQPARLVLALRSAVRTAGVELHERSPAVRVAGRLVETPSGRVRAPAVVLATNAALTGWRPTARRLTNFGSYVVLTEPVPELLERIGWTGGEAIVDARMFLHYFRTTADGRVLMGSGSGPIGFGGRIDRRFLEDEATALRAELGLRRLLPALADVRVERAWGGPVDVSADRLPFVGTTPDGIHYAAGFSGNGVGPSWLAAQALGSLAAGRRDQWTAPPLVGRRVPPLPPEPFKSVGGAAVRAAQLAVEEAEEEGRRPPTAARAVAVLPRLLRMRVGTR